MTKPFIFRENCRLYYGTMYNMTFERGMIMGFWMWVLVVVVANLLSVALLALAWKSKRIQIWIMNLYFDWMTLYVEKRMERDFD